MNLVISFILFNTPESPASRGYFDCGMCVCVGFCVIFYFLYFLFSLGRGVTAHGCRDLLSGNLTTPASRPQARKGFCTAAARFPRLFSQIGK